MYLEYKINNIIINLSILVICCKQKREKYNKKLIFMTYFNKLI